MNVKFIESGEVFNLDINPHRDGNHACPVCSKQRKKKGTKTLRWYKLTPGEKEKGGTGFCHHCRSWCHIVLSDKEKQEYARRHNLNSDTTFVQPPAGDRRATTTHTEPLTPERCDRLLKEAFPEATRYLSDKAADWLAGRGIDREVAAQLGIFSTIRYNKEVIAFVYRYKGLDYNIKFRELDNKKYSFFLTGAPTIAYNAEALHEAEVVIVTEGEMDALSYAQAGIICNLSVPTGGAGMQLKWLEAHADDLAQIKQFYLATDNDECGDKLRDTLLNLWGYDRCRVVSYNGYKDANELLMAEGINAIYETLENSILIKPKNKNVIDMASRRKELIKFFEGGGLKGEKLDFAPLDAVASWRTGALALITGIPGHGKSGFLDFLMMRLNRQLGWKAMVYSPENYPDVHHYSKLIAMINNKQFDPEAMSLEMCLAAYDELSLEYSFVNPELTKLQDVLDAIEWQVKHYGIKMASIDPFNVLEIEQAANAANAPETEVINRALDKMHRLARRLNILLFLIAHPRKMDHIKARTTRTEPEVTVHNAPSLYDVMGSAHFYNHIDYGIIVYRDFSKQDASEQKTHVIFEKIKWGEMGSPGKCTLDFNVETNRYEDPDGDKSVEELEDTSWLRLS